MSGQTTYNQLYNLIIFQEIQKYCTPYSISNHFEKMIADTTVIIL